MSAVVFAFGNAGPAFTALCDTIGADRGAFEYRRFPDDESYVRIASDVQDRSVIVLSPLDRPDPKFVPLHFLASVCRAQGAARVGLVAPYLAYMRQDRQFRPGEAVGSKHFANLLASTFNWLVTVDPHLHRVRDLSELYSIPSRAVHAAPAVSEWIRDAVDKPVLVGPDEESEQWVSAVAQAADAPWVVLDKERRGDRDVSVSVPHVEQWRGHVPVLVDDIISTGRTMIETVGHLREAGMKPPVCVGVHAVFAGDAFRALQESGADRVVTCNTIPHESNGIDVVPRIAEAVQEFV